MICRASVVSRSAVYRPCVRYPPPLLGTPQGWHWRSCFRVRWICGGKIPMERTTAPNSLWKGGNNWSPPRVRGGNFQDGVQPCHMFILRDLAVLLLNHLVSGLVCVVCIVVPCLVKRSAPMRYILSHQGSHRRKIKTPLDFLWMRPTIFLNCFCVCFLWGHTCASCQFCLTGHSL